MTSRVKLVEVGPRDGLQNEKQPVHRLQEADLIDGWRKCVLNAVTNAWEERFSHV